jgi:predicted AAA+ superfamily ATPase
VTVKKPALFKQTFELACCYGGQIISLNKLLGQLQEGGNIDLVKYYLSLLEKAFLIKTIPKFSTNNLQKRGSSPKIIPLALALMDLFEVEDKGRIFEVAVGIELLQHFDQVYYWRDKNDEVDYIVKIGKKIIGIEVKSGNKRQLQGLNAFAKKFPTAKTLLVTEENFTSVVEIVHLL